MLKLKNEIIDGSQYTYVYIVTNKTLYTVPSWRVASNNNGTGVSSVTIYMLSQFLIRLCEFYNPMLNKRIFFILSVLTVILAIIGIIFDRKYEVKHQRLKDEEIMKYFTGTVISDEALVDRYRREIIDCRDRNTGIRFIFLCLLCLLIYGLSLNGFGIDLILMIGVAVFFIAYSVYNDHFSEAALFIKKLEKEGLIHLIQSIAVISQKKEQL